MDNPFSDNGSIGSMTDNSLNDGNIESNPEDLAGEMKKGQKAKKVKERKRYTLSKIKGKHRNNSRNATRTQDDEWGFWPVICSADGLSNSHAASMSSGIGDSGAGGLIGGVVEGVSSVFECIGGLFDVVGGIFGN